MVHFPDYQLPARATSATDEEFIREAQHFCAAITKTSCSAGLSAGKASAPIRRAFRLNRIRRRHDLLFAATWTYSKSRKFSITLVSLSSTKNGLTIFRAAKPDLRRCRRCRGVRKGCRSGSVLVRSWRFAATGNRRTRQKPNEQQTFLSRASILAVSQKQSLSKQVLGYPCC